MEEGALCLFTAGVSTCCIVFTTCNLWSFAVRPRAEGLSRSIWPPEIDSLLDCALGNEGDSKEWGKEISSDGICRHTSESRIKEIIVFSSMYYGFRNSLNVFTVFNLYAVQTGASWYRRDGRSRNSVWENSIFMPTGAGIIYIHGYVLMFVNIGGKTVVIIVTFIIGIVLHFAAAWPRSLDEKRKSENSHSVSQPGHSRKSHSRSRHFGWSGKCTANTMRSSSRVSLIEEVNGMFLF